MGEASRDLTGRAALLARWEVKAFLKGKCKVV